MGFFKNKKREMQASCIHEYKIEVCAKVSGRDKIGRYERIVDLYKCQKCGHRIVIDEFQNQMNYNLENLPLNVPFSINDLIYPNKFIEFGFEGEEKVDSAMGYEVEHYQRRLVEFIQSFTNYTIKTIGKELRFMNKIDFDDKIFYKSIVNEKTSSDIIDEMIEDSLNY